MECKVLGIDFDKQKINLAKESGADTLCLSDDLDIINYAKSFSKRAWRRFSYNYSFL